MKLQIHQPLQPLIDFSARGFNDPEPRRCWVSKREIFVLHFENKTKIAIAHHIEDAEEGRYTWKSADELQPYSDELWRACERWFKRREQLSIDIGLLSRGKIIEERAMTLFDLMEAA